MSKVKQPLKSAYLRYGLELTTESLQINQKARPRYWGLNYN